MPAPSKHISRRLALAMALFCVVVWGVSYAVIRETVQQIPPLSLASLRHLAGAALLWPLTRARFGAVPIPPRHHAVMCGLALCGISLYFGFENHGLKLTTASHGALIIALIPLGTELVTALRQRRMPHVASWIGTALALAGVSLLVGRNDGAASLEGDLLMLGAVASWIGYTFGVNRFAGRYPGLLLTRQIMLWGGLTLLPASLWELAVLRPDWPGLAAWLGFAYLTVICSVVGYDFWNRAVPRLGPSTTNNLLYLLPLVGVATGVIALGEPLAPSLFIGGGLILAGVMLAGRSRPVPDREGCHAEE